jgi:hypothetical protein
MGVLEQVLQMKRQGATDIDIAEQLKEEGISPREINDALNQSQIKSAVSAGEEEMESSMMPPKTPMAPVQAFQEPTYMPHTKEFSQENYSQQEQQQQAYPYPQQEVYQGYDTAYQAPQENYNDNIIEIAEQVFAEEFKTYNKKISEFSEFKTLAQSQVENLSERLRRIESSIDKLQAAILEKVGAYGNTLQNIKSEMNMMQDSFSKAIPELAKHKHKK